MMLRLRFVKIIIKELDIVAKISFVVEGTFDKYKIGYNSIVHIIYCYD